MSYGNWEPVIGLEIHAQLLTKSKMFSGDSAEYGGQDNENISVVSLGMPGALPVVNKRAIEFSILIGLALNCEIKRRSVFARKNYFYPDLPKGYQISQFEEPLCERGFVEVMVDGEKRRIGITRAHMEEDAGKSTHHGEYTLVNLNRAGVPLLEIVSEPEIRSPVEAGEYARTIRSILRYLDACDGNLEQGSMRCDCNVSVRKKGEKKFGTKVEIKNVNSFRFVEKAIDYEIKRQIDAIEQGDLIVQETRLYDATKNRTYSMRSKEEAHDYRYFPDPDLLPIELKDGDIEALKKSLPELPNQKAERFQKEYGLPTYDSFVLVQDKALSKYFEDVAKKTNQAKMASNWIMGEVLRELKENDLDISETKISSDMLSELILKIEDKTISGKMAKTVFAEMWKTGKDAKDIIKEKGLVQITDDSAIEKIVDDCVAANPNQVAQYKAGKQKLFGFFVGQVMKASKGQANPDKVNEILKKKLQG